MAVSYPIRWLHEGLHKRRAITWVTLAIVIVSLIIIGTAIVLFLLFGPSTSPPYP